MERPKSPCGNFVARSNGVYCSKNYLCKQCEYILYLEKIIKEAVRYYIQEDWIYFPLHEMEEIIKQKET